ncbi:MAG: hypothetical protein ACFFDY_01975 [Candidatus Thorarchaeota archaeon]
MIFQLKDVFFIPLAKIAGYFLLIVGVMWLVYGVYEAKRRGSVKKRKIEEWDFNITAFLKGLTYIGLIVGIFGILCGVGGLMYNVPPSARFVSGEVSIFTSVLLIIIGIFTLLKPINDLPIASIIGLLAGSAVIAILVMVLPSQAYEVIDIFIDARLFFIILFIIIFAIVALTAKFYIGGLMKISKFISWPPIAFIVAGFCFLQGFLVLVMGISIGYLF